MIGILTFQWADDCGAMLQAFGLKRFVEKLGEDAEILPYAPYRLIVRYMWLPMVVKSVNGRCFYRPNPAAWLSHIRSTAFFPRRRAMRRFRSTCLTNEKPVRKAQALSAERFNCVFVGSDQVWNPDITIGLDDAYLGGLPDKERCRLVSYAASLGGYRFTGSEREIFTEKVRKNFDAVSLREASDVPFVEELLGTRVDAVLDPVFLPERGDWESIAASVPEKNYILVYRTEYNQELADYVQKLSHDTGLSVLMLSPQSLRERKMGWRVPKLGVGPAEFIGYFLSAACVVTNSFHATAFSVLLQKQFVTFRHSSRNARLSDLLSAVGLEERITDGQAAPDIFAGIDWGTVRARLENKRQKSKKFIIEQIRISGGEAHEKQ